MSDVPLTETFSISQKIELTEGFRQLSGPRSQQARQIGIARARGTFQLLGDRPTDESPLSVHGIDCLVVRGLEDPRRVHGDVAAGRPQRKADILEEVFDLVPGEAVLVSNP